VSNSYVHGYGLRENERLQDQAGALVELLHSDTAYPEGSLVLEAGCGVGAQTVPLATRSPGASFVGLIDAASFDAGIDALRRTTDSDGVFS
jgi:tRNA G46 methylase TrmB